MENTWRKILVNLPNERDQKLPYIRYGFCTNKVYTSKYSVWSFIPKNLAEQFRSVANFYFLFLVVLQAFEPFSIVSIGLTAAPIIIIVGVTAVKDATEDYRRHKSDKMVNSAETYILSNWKNENYCDQMPNSSGRKGLSKIKDMATAKKTSVHETKPDYISDFDENSLPVAHLGPTDKPIWKKCSWQDVRVGDFVLILNNDSIPADIIIVSSSEAEAVCYVETKNLDGETNLKVHRGIREFEHISKPEQCAEIKCSIDTEPPSAHMYNFTGTAVIPGKADMQNKLVPLGITSILLRGCILRNTKWVIGIVSATGDHTKLMMNSGITPSKRSRIERQLNPQVSVSPKL